MQITYNEIERVYTFKEILTEGGVYKVREKQYPNARLIIINTSKPIHIFDSGEGVINGLLIPGWEDYTFTKVACNKITIEV